MRVPNRYILRPGAVVGALGRTALKALQQGLGGRTGGSVPVTPGPELFVAGAAGGPAYLTGTFAMRGDGS